LSIGELDYATHCMLQAVDIDCASADAYYYLGVVSAIKGAFDEAAEFFSHTLDINSEHIRALGDSAAVYLAMGRLEDAAMRIKKALDSAGNDSQLKALGRKIRLAQIIERIVDFLRRLRPQLMRRKSLR